MCFPVVSWSSMHLNYDNFQVYFCFSTQELKEEWQRVRCIQLSFSNIIYLKNWFALTLNWELHLRVSLQFYFWIHGPGMTIIFRSEEHRDLVFWIWSLCLMLLQINASCWHSWVSRSAIACRPECDVLRHCCSVYFKCLIVFILHLRQSLLPWIVIT